MRYWLKLFREKKGLTQEEVAKLVGNSRAAYRHIESGERGVIYTHKAEQDQGKL